MSSSESTYSPFAVAKFFLQEAGPEDNMTPMKLIKLVYIAHGWHLGLFRAPLIAERAQAWKYGPVVPSVYDQYKRFGRDPIPGGEAHDIASEIEPGDARTRQLLATIWARYGGYDGLQLSTLTHQKNTPWYQVWHEQGGKDRLSVPIPNDLIQAHYQEIISRRLIELENE